MQDKKSHNLQVKGVTLVEMVVAISLMTVALSAMLPLLRSIQNSWDSRQGAAEVLQNGRVLSDHLYRELAGATQITDVSTDSDSTGYIEFVDSGGVSRRYETGDNGYVQFGAVGSLSDLAGPVSRFQFTCYDGNDFSTPTTDAASIRFLSVETTYTNAASLGPDKTVTTAVYLRTGAIGESAGEVDSHIAVKDCIYISGWGSLIDSYRSSAGAYDARRAGSDAVISVNEDANWSILLWNWAVVRGDAYIGPGGSLDYGIVVGYGSELTGTKGELDTPLDIADVSAPTGLTSYTSSGGSGRTGRGHGGGGTSNSIQLSGSSTATISSDCETHEVRLEDYSKLIIKGDVTLVVTDTFDMSEYAELEISSDSSLALYVAKTLDVSGHAALNESTKDPSRLRIYMTDNNRDFTMEDDAVVYAVLQNPQGTVYLWDNSEFFGKLRAEDLSCSGKIHVDLDCGFDSGND